MQFFSGLESSFGLDVKDAKSTLESYQQKSSSLILLKSLCVTPISRDALNLLDSDIYRLVEYFSLLKDKLKTFKDEGYAKTWLETYLSAKPKPNVLGQSIEITPESKGYKLSSDVSYTFTTFKADDTVDKTFPFSKAFKHYKRTYVQLYGGINYSAWSNVDRVIIPDEEAEQVDPRIESNPFQFVAGIKIYPCGGVLEDNRFLAINQYRWHLNLGFSIPKPLENIYTGIGYDIVPGWDINLNLQFYRDKEYTIIDGEVEKSRSIYRPAFAIGTGVDVSVFVNAVKFFF